MFGVYFGKYLQDVGVLTAEQYDEIIEESRRTRVKMGTLAVYNGMMTEAQAEEVNQIQAVKDARFGDIAIEKGYLTENDLDVLLKKQGDSYLLFVQSLLERKILGLEEIQKNLNNFKKAERLTALDIDAIKSSDIDKIVPVFLKDVTTPAIIRDYIALMARNIVRFIDNKIRLESIERVTNYTSKYIASQSFTGDYELFIGIGGDGNKIIGEAYAKEEFDSVDEDCLDSVCEFINITNGLFASRVSKEDDVKIDMLPPCMYPEVTTVSSEGLMFVVPCFIRNVRTDIVICMESKWKIN